MSIKTKKPRFITTLLVILTVILFLIITTAILSIGEKVSSFNPWAGYLFYALAVVLIFIFIVLPFLKILAAPALPDFLAKDAVSGKKAIKFILKNGKNSTDSEIKKKAAEWKREYRANPENSPDIVREYGELVDEAIKKIISKKTRDTFFLTGVSQKGTFDLLICIMINISMINEIVKVSGRPNFRQLLEIYWGILVGAFTAMTSQTGLTALNNTLNIGSKVANVFTQIFGVILSSLASGAVNAGYTAHIGYIAKVYILSGGNQERLTADKEKIRKEAQEDAEKVEKENKAALEKLQKESRIPEQKKFAGFLHKN
ncbi:hypothetical protein AGMMS49944_21230 [Spirochaetia bacterium]|nr:hypothetical protein AGMMS49944_21230 [Spirochaetia bacterium]